jgi:hypothetical protein
MKMQNKLPTISIHPDRWSILRALNRCSREKLNKAVLKYEVFPDVGEKEWANRKKYITTTLKEFGVKIVEESEKMIERDVPVGQEDGQVAEFPMGIGIMKYEIEMNSESLSNRIISEIKKAELQLCDEDNYGKERQQTIVLSTLFTISSMMGKREDLWVNYDDFASHHAHFSKQCFLFNLNKLEIIDGVVEIKEAHGAPNLNHILNLSPSFLDFCKKIGKEANKTSKTSGETRGNTIQNWSDITLRFLGEENVSILVNGVCVEKKVEYKEMGFGDEVRNKGNICWGLLIKFAKNNRIEPPEKKKEAVKKNISNLRFILRKYFRLNEDPFHPFRISGNCWIPKFKVSIKTKKRREDVGQIKIEEPEEDELGIKESFSEQTPSL